MAKGRRFVPTIEEQPAAQADTRDILIEELRQQIQQLQQRLEHFEDRGKAVQHEDLDNGSSSNDEGNTNPFHQAKSHSSGDSSPIHPNVIRNMTFRNDRRDFHVKVEIPDFEGRMHPDEFVDWLNTIERIFDYQDVPENQKVKVVAIKLKKYASLWWENLRKQRIREGRSKIVTWEKMKRELKRKYLPDNYRQDIFLKLHNFRQKELSVEDYTAEFDHLMLKCDMVEQEEQTIARYLGGLRPEISNIVQLQPYWTYGDVCRLALKVENQQKTARSGNSRFLTREGFSNRGNTSNSKSIPTAKPTTRTSSKNDGVYNQKKQNNASNTNSRQCFKCQGYGHIASECPNRRIMTLVEKEDEEEMENNHTEPEEENDDITYEDEGETLILRKVLSAAYEEEEEDWLRKNIFHTRCTSHGKVCNVIIDGG